MGTYSCNPSTLKGRVRVITKYEANPGYKMSFRAAWATE